ncbi:hypothetical protein J2W42_002431 [Rhizobium tibeticum]|uniref:hypothetical protein n=1 Tax=Rhizobium tibeticum TaxID=501024 RepID=UPI00277F0B84|nr:hypothetical protein [Rhizobium tibeticum]MDP9809579.1 hypothetical protein [Rhizobium tibeticum]
MTMRIFWHTEFTQFDFRELAHLCAGIDYLFGKDGILARNVVSKGLGEPSFPYDPNNPYIRVPSPAETREMT